MLGCALGISGPSTLIGIIFLMIVIWGVCLYFSDNIEKPPQTYDEFKEVYSRKQLFFYRSMLVLIGGILVAFAVYLFLH